MKEIYVVLAISLIVFFVLFKNIFKRKIKGYIGEYEVSNVLSKLNKRQYRVFNDVKVTINGSVSQIDHVVVSQHGIFVIETKNYKGIIKGTEQVKEWTQVLNKEKRTFYNPILQNQGHIYALQYLFKGISDLKYHSIIVFTDKAAIKTKTSTSVIYPDQLLHSIKRHKNKSIEKELVNELTSRLTSRKSNSSKSEKHYKSNPAVLKTKCPKCGNALIKRVGKFGNFIGCTNYPSCNFTKN